MSGGLTAAEVARRVAAGQVNNVSRKSSRSLAEIVRGNVFTLFNLVIAVLWALIMVFGAWKDGLFGLVIVANAAIGIIQELRSKQTLDQLAVVNEQPVKVMRDGAQTEVHPDQVVLDDLVLLELGDRLLVDGKVESAAGLEIDESLLTGEADPIHKRPGDEVLSGSFVVAGTGSYQATKVGAEAYAAQLAAEASKFTLAKSELRDGINQFIKVITWLIVPIGALLIISQLRRPGVSFGEAMTGAVAGVVTMIPEGLVLMTSMAFAVGVIRLGQRRALVQELPAIEGLARVDVLCLDKTGTLTAPGMDLSQIRPLADGAETVLAAMAWADPNPNPTMEALRAHFADGPGWTVTGSMPFSSARKWSGMSFDGQGMWAIGAADVLLESETSFRADADALAATGLRVLALCRTDSLEPLGELSPAAIIAFQQRIRPDAAKTLRYFAEQDVTIKVISGDNPDSVSAIAQSLNIPGADKAIDARTMSEGDLADLLETHTVFGRVTPQQKREFVRALQSRGHTVAMTGDGVNDCLALKDADLGVAMGSGSGATKAVAQIVLLDDNFDAMPHVVAEGRRVLGNIERVSTLFLNKTFYAIVLSLLTGVIGLAFPFRPIHLTLISALTIGIPGFFLALAPNLERARPGFVRRVLRFAVPAGLLCGLATYLAFWLARHTPTDLKEDSTTASITLFLLSLAVLLLIARPWNWWRLGLVALMGAAFLVVLAVPRLRNFFELYPDSLANDGMGVAIALGASALLALILRLTRR